MYLREYCGWTYALVTLSLLTLRLSAGHKCVSQSLEDMVIDIQSSLARGIRGNEPTHAASQEDCLSSCCSTRNIAGDKACNLMIFDARKAAGQPNCYLFFCPQEASCPLKPAAAGLSTHRVFPDDPTWTGAAVDPSPGRASVTPSPLGSTPSSGRGASSQMSESSSPLQQLFQTDSRGTQVSQILSQRASLSPARATASSTPGGAAPSQPAASAPVTPEPTVPHAPGTPQAPPAPSQPPAAPVSAHVPPAVTSAVVPAEVQGTRETQAPGTTSSRPVPASAPLSPSTTTTWGRGEARGHPSPPGGAQQSRGGLSFERWLLLGTLLSGVLLLALGLLLLGRALLQALRTRPYSRLDYLINGVYVGI